MPICKKEVKTRSSKSQLRLIVMACVANAKAAAASAVPRVRTDEELAAKAERKAAWEQQKADKKARRRGEHHERA
jgi:hypothetical protein